MRRMKVGLLLGAFVLCSSGVAFSEHPSCNGVITPVETPAATLYVDDRSGGAPELNHWIYQESNGAAGLQSGGVSVLGDAVSVDDCEDVGHSAVKDTLIF